MSPHAARAGPMAWDHAYLSAFARFLASRGLRLTNQRRQLARVVMATHDHLTVDELAALARRKALPIGRATIYRTIDLLCQAGLVHGHDFGQGTRRYEAMFGHCHHDHMRCTGCGRIIEFQCAEIERLQEEVARRNRFTMESHRLQIFGLCHTCCHTERGRRSSRSTGATP
jgi:Fur family ferric uptake transcriptional regulator